MKYQGLKSQVGDGYESKQSNNRNNRMLYSIDIF